MSVVNDNLNRILITEHIESGKNFLREHEEVYTIEVPAKTISTVLSQHGISKIDFLSLDVEGYEVQVLNGLNFNIHRPHFMLIEVRNKEEIESIIFPTYKSIAVLSANDSFEVIFYMKSGDFSLSNQGITSVPIYF
jgi:hypothetical protein